MPRMATVTSKSFLPGVTVNAYAKDRNPSAAPNAYTGSSLGSGVVDAAGSVSITGLADRGDFVLTDGTKRVTAAARPDVSQVYADASGNLVTRSTGASVGAAKASDVYSARTRNAVASKTLLDILSYTFPPRTGMTESRRLRMTVRNTSAVIVEVGPRNDLGQNASKPASGWIEVPAGSEAVIDGDPRTWFVRPKTSTDIPIQVTVEREVAIGA